MQALSAFEPNLAVSSGLLEKGCGCGVSSVSSGPAKPRFCVPKALSHGRKQPAPTWDSAQPCSWAFTGRRAPRSWPPTFPPSDTLASRCQVTSCETRLSTGRKRRVKLAGPKSCSLPAWQVSCLQSKAALFFSRQQPFLCDLQPLSLRTS